ncbi:MAG TPA: hypothetical protein VIK89_02255, partial [Cytophagaceae bacterium]
MAESIEETRLRIEEFIKEIDPYADISPGSVLSELLVKLAATLHNPIKNDIDELNQASNISAVLESPEDTYSPIIDKIASNYGVTRGQGSKSVGKLKVTVAGLRTYHLPAGFTFYQPVLKLNYLTSTKYRVTSNPVNANDLRLYNS